MESNLGVSGFLRPFHAAATFEGGNGTNQNAMGGFWLFDVFVCEAWPATVMKPTVGSRSISLSGPSTVSESRTKAEFQASGEEASHSNASYSKPFAP